MTERLSITPLPFNPDFEQVPDDESETISGLIQAMREIAETTFADGGHAIRSVHAKSHGLLQGEIEVLPDLPPELAQGAFAKPGKMPVVMRYSTNPGDILDDKVSTPRGLAIKLIGVEGERLPNSDAEVTQDFVMVNAPAFMVPTPWWKKPAGKAQRSKAWAVIPPPTCSGRRTTAWSRCSMVAISPSFRWSRCPRN